MNKTRLYILLSILPFLAFITNVKAVQMDYDFSGYNKATQVQFGLYNNTTLVQDALTTCTSSNDGFCAFENGDLSNTEVTFNNLRFVIRGTDGVTFTSGGQYKMSFFFLSNTSDYYITAGTLTNTTGVSYQNFSNWTSNDLGIVSSNIIAIETKSTGADTTATLYRVDIVFSVSSSTVAGFNIRLYRNNKTIYSTTPCDIELFRYFSVSEVTPGSIDYSQDLNNINQSIGGLSDDISDSTQDIIDNQNSNTQDIIDNQNQNAQDIIESGEVCQKIVVDNNSIVLDNYVLLQIGTLREVSGYGVTDYYKFSNAKYLQLKARENLSGGRFFCFYDENKNLIGECVAPLSYSVNEKISVPTSAVYARFTINKSLNLPQFVIESCKNGNQAITDSLTDDDVSGANSSASNFFSSFTTETYGLTSVITSPLTFIQSLTSKTCSPLVLPLPYVNRNLELPCMRSIYEQHFGGFLSIYQTITFGIISYWVVVRIFNLVKDFKNPDHDEIEVMDL